jgi:hypothetical protein
MWLLNIKYKYTDKDLILNVPCEALRDEFSDSLHPEDLCIRRQEMYCLCLPRGPQYLQHMPTLPQCVLNQVSVLKIKSLAAAVHLNRSTAA